MALNPYPHKALRAVLLGRFLAAAAIVVVIAGCSLIGGKATSPTTTTTTTSRPPVAVGALDELLLSPNDVGTAMGAAGMSVKQTDSKMYDDSTDIPAAACRNSSPADTSVYAGSGWTAVRIQYLRDDGDNYTHEAEQAVVSFPSANQASAFYNSAASRWNDCANRQYHVVRAGRPDMIWTVGPISNSSGMLSATRVREGGNGWSCHRVLTASNNIAIDLVACGYSDPTDAAVSMARQIRAKVAKQ
jgi:PknH-like extracellular domain